MGEVNHEPKRNIIPLGFVHFKVVVLRTPFDLASSTAYIFVQLPSGATGCLTTFPQHGIVQVNLA